MDKQTESHACKQNSACVCVSVCGILTDTLHITIPLISIMIFYILTGDLTVYNRFEKYAPGSTMTHANDLKEIITKEQEKNPKKKCLLLVTDNGCDWSQKSLLTYMYLGRLWRDLNLDMLVHTTYRAGFSKYNMIEHRWAPLSHSLAAVTLPGPEPDSSRNEEIEAYTKAADMLSQHWDRLSNVECRTIKIDEEPQPYNDKDELHRMLTKAGVTELQKNSDCISVRKELEFFAPHSIVRHNQEEFYKCRGPNVCDHCKENPWQSEKMLDLLERSHGILASPTPSPYFPGHYLTAIDIYGQPGVNDRRFVPQLNQIDEELEKMGIIHSKCKNGCKFELRSKNAEERHLLLFHMELRQRMMRRKRSANNFECAVCGHVAESKWLLYQHKSKEGHVRKYNKKPRKNVESDSESDMEN